MDAIPPLKPAVTRVPKILIVEDDIEVLRAVADMVIHLGYAPCVCHRADDVQSYLDKHKIDLLLVDYRMPEMTGLDLILLLRQDNRNIPFIMMTGYEQTESRVSAVGLENPIILRKPVTAGQLATAIESALKLGVPAPQVV